MKSMNIWLYNLLCQNINVRQLMGVSYAWSQHSPVSEECVGQFISDSLKGCTANLWKYPRYLVIDKG